MQEQMQSAQRRRLLIELAQSTLHQHTVLPYAIVKKRVTIKPGYPAQGRGNVRDAYGRITRVIKVEVSPVMGLDPIRLHFLVLESTPEMP